MKNTITFLIVLITGIGIGLAFSHWWSGPEYSAVTESADTEREILYWKAPMDPNYRSDEPGKSPMGMDLVPVYAADSGDDESVVTISPQVVNNLGVRTEQAQYSVLSRRIDTVGYVGYDEDTLQHIHTRVDGWIESLEITATGDPVSQGQELGNRVTAPISKAVALGTASASVEGPILHLFIIQSGFLALRAVDSVLHLASQANCADQTLGQDAAQRRDEVVGFDSHVPKAANHVEGIVRVNSGEDQVARQRGLNRDLCRFQVPDLAHHDLVRVMAQDRPEPARKRHALFLVHRDLDHALELVLHRILNRDDLVLLGIDLIDRGIQGRCLAAPGRACHQHHAVGFRDRAPEEIGRASCRERV